MCVVCMCVWHVVFGVWCVWCVCGECMCWKVFLFIFINYGLFTLEPLLGVLVYLFIYLFGNIGIWTQCLTLTHQAFLLLEPLHQPWKIFLRTVLSAIRRESSHGIWWISSIFFEGWGWDKVSLCHPGCPWTHDPPASASQMLGLQYEPSCLTHHRIWKNVTIRNGRRWGRPHWHQKFF
jgi:hypothetical protein